MIDDMGNQIYPGSIDNGATDVEYSPTIERKICAADERFASVNEAIGRLEYNLEQHIAHCGDALAPLADFITSCWAVMDEVIDRVAKLEAAQPKPVPDAYAHIPIAEWLDFKEELEALRAKWESVPWEQINAMRMALAQVFRDKLVQWPSTQRAMFDVEKWLGENMPQEAAE